MAVFSIGFTLLADRLCRFFTRLSSGEAATEAGKEILGFIVAAALAAAIAVVVDLWLNDARARRRYSRQRSGGDAAKGAKAPGWSHRGRDWVIIAGTVVCAFTLFAMAAYAITAMVGERIALG
jgi:hypothetical protein